MTTRRTVLAAGASMLALTAARTARADCRSTLSTQDSQADGCVVLRLYKLPRRGQPEAALSMAQLQKLPQKSIRTRLPANFQVNGLHHWQGPPLSAVLNRHGMLDKRGVYAESITGYGAQLPYRDLLDYEPILAWQHNGQAMSVRHNGPLLVIYPFDNHPALKQDIRYLQRTVWQVQSLVVL